MDFINNIVHFYDTHKEQLVVYYLAGQTVAKGVQDSLTANKDKTGSDKFFGIVSSFLSYLGLGKRA